MASSVIEYVIQDNLKYYPDYDDLHEIIDNPSFDPFENEFYERYIVDENDDHSDMRFAMIYEGKNLVLVGDVDEGSTFYDIVGDIPDMYGDSILGFNILLDMIHQDTVPQTQTEFQSYISRLLIIEGKSFKDQRKTSPFFLIPENNPDFYSTDVAWLWSVDHDDMYSRGIYTVNQLKAAIKQGILAVSNETQTALNYFMYEEYASNIDASNVVATLNESEVANFSFEEETNLEEIVVNVESDESVDEVARDLLNEGYISDILESSSSEAKVYFQVSDKYYIRLVLTM